jgi:hypothetical protein
VYFFSFCVRESIEEEEEEEEEKDRPSKTKWDCQGAQMSMARATYGGT